MQENRIHTMKNHNYTIPRQLIDVVNYIDENITEPIRIEELSEITIWGKTHLSRLFKKYFNLTVYQYILEKRIELGKELLIKEDIYVSEVYFKCGFQSYSNFFHAFKKYTSMSPQQFIFFYRSKINKNSNY